MNIMVEFISNLGNKISSLIANHRKRIEMSEIRIDMNRYRAKVTLYFRAIDIDHANGIISALVDANDKPEDYAFGFGSVQFKHPTLGWVPVDQSGSDDDLDGEACLRQG